MDFNTVAKPRPPVTFSMNPAAVLAGAAPVFMRSFAPQVAIASVALGLIGMAFNGLSRKPERQLHLQHPVATPNLVELNPPAEEIRHDDPVVQAEPEIEPATTEAPPPPTPLADALDSAEGLKHSSPNKAAVKHLQEFLQKAGCGDLLGKTGPHHDGVDGVFKDKTKHALEKFQEDHHLPKTGTLDKATLKAMHEVEQSWNNTHSLRLAPFIRERDPYPPDRIHIYQPNPSTYPLVFPLHEKPQFSLPPGVELPEDRPSIEMPSLDQDSAPEPAKFRPKPSGGMTP